MAYCQTYLEEEKNFIAHNPLAAKDEQGHLTDLKDIAWLTKLFDPITFTRRAAEELDVRIRRFLKENGVAIPTHRPFRDKEIPWQLGRTVDSRIQSIFFHPLFRKTFLKNNPDWFTRTTELAAVLQQNPHGRTWLEEQKQADGHYADEFGWAQIKALEVWGCQLFGDDQDLLCELVALEHMHWSWDNITNLKAKAHAALLTATLEELRAAPQKGGIKVKVIEQLRKVTSGANARFVEAETKLEQDLTELQPAARQALIEYLQPYHQKNRFRTEFMTACQATRSFGYDPIKTPQLLGESNIINLVAEIAETNEKGPLTLDTFEHLVTTLKQAKMDFACYDFPDFINAVITEFQRNPFLLEANKAFPRLGLRRRHTIIDEAQDNDTAQWQWVAHFEKALGPGNTLYVVGDPAQSIYAYRGANPDGLSDLIRHETNSIWDTYHLSHSWRSTPAIVALGNEIIDQLSDYCDDKQPSLAAHDNLKGTIQICPTTHPTTEADLVIELATQAIAAKESILFLHRANGDKTPAYQALKSNRFLEKKLVRFMSVHQSKGLEADRVALIGCTAGKWPDPRGDEQQEINLWYVACTRARRHLTIITPLNQDKLDKEGQIDTKPAGPTPFIAWLPSLTKLWTATQTPAHWLQTGLDTHTQERAEKSSVKAARRKKLQAQAAAAFNSKPEPKPGHHHIYSVGKTNPKATAAWIKTRSQTGDQPQPESGDILENNRPPHQNETNPLQPLSTEQRRLLHQLHFIRKRTSLVIPFLSKKDDWNLGFKSGWWTRNPITSKWEFTVSYLRLETCLQEEKHNARCAGLVSP